MKLKNLLSIFCVLLITVLTLSTVKATSDYYDIQKVEVEDREVSPTDTNFVVAERGQEIKIDVWLLGTPITQTPNVYDSIDNVRVKAWIGGYEYGDVDEKSSAFKVEQNGTYHKTLYLKIPDDIDADKDGNSEDYTLNVEVYDQTGNERKNYQLRITEKRHDIRIQDVILRPDNSVSAGDRLFATVRVENMGDNIEKDIQVKASISELGIETRDYIDELVPEKYENDNDEKSSDDVDLFLPIPKSAKTGDYKLNVELIYSRGHEKISEEYLIHVEGAKEISITEEAIISVDAVEKQINAGSEVAYKIMFANFGDEKKTYSAEVVGIGVWGTANVDPAFIVLNAGETGELYVKITPNADASGKHPFTVKIRKAGSVVKEVNLNADVISVTTEKAANWTRLKHGLEIGFVVLAILLVILGLIIAFNKLKGGEEEKPGMAGESGQTYY